MTLIQDARLNEDGLAKENGYADTMKDLVMPYVASRQEKSTLQGAGGVSLSVSRFSAESPRGTLVLVHGFTSSVEKFDELIFSLLQNGWSVLTYDQRGHGFSGRDPQIQDISLVHVDRFEDYVEDLETVCGALLPGMPRPHVLFCHSMGGAVSGLFVEAHPDQFVRAVFCSPMIAPYLNGLPTGVARGICRLMGALGQKKARIFASKPYAGPEEFETSCASGQARFDWYNDLRDRTPAYHTNGPTYQWTLESIQVTGKLLAPGAVEKIRIPVIVYGAQDEFTVVPEAQQRFADRLENGKRVVVAGARHEIYRSPDAVLFPWWHEILSFYDEA